jgi:hypothetical protein
MSSAIRVSIGVNDPLADKVIRSPFFLTNCAAADVLAVAEYGIDVDFVGGFFGGAAGKDRCTPFAALVCRLLFMLGAAGAGATTPTAAAASGAHAPDATSTSSVSKALLDLVDEFVAQPHHKYLRLLGIVCLRLMIGTAADRNLGADGGQALMLRVHRALDTGFLDYRRVRVMNPDGSVVVTTVDQVCDMLLFPPAATQDFLGFALPMLPTRRQIQELFPRAKLLNNSAS